MSEHTPGPWRVGSPTGHNACHIYGQGDVVCQMYGLPLHTMVEEIDPRGKWAAGLANARLVAAAPTMLDAHIENVRILQFLLNELQGRVEGGKLAALQGCLDRCNESIAAALNHEQR